MASRESGMGGMAGIRATLYNTLMRRNSIYVTACIIGSYAMTRAYFAGTDSIWRRMNQGKSWEEVRERLPPKEDDDDDDDED